ncbi:DUF3899 domain-containing protein [Bacillus anthracis]|uniref:DUF3899 domain-containing protein n=1 Tax=Bacillus anthracis TaxID=1392 RepID=UPI0005CD9BC3|nr:DUF3899 domain-containing protein [Bacillus anthracis]
MNKVFFHTCILIFIAIIASSIGAFLVSSQFLLNFVNISFYIALFFILIGGFLVFGTNKKIDSLIEEVEEPIDKKERIYKTYSFKWTYPICITGIVLGLFSTFISFTILM